MVKEQAANLTVLVACFLLAFPESVEDVMGSAKQESHSVTDYRRYSIGIVVRNDWAQETSGSVK